MISHLLFGNRIILRYILHHQERRFSDKIDDRTGDGTDIYLTKLDKKNKWAAPNRR